MELGARLNKELGVGVSAGDPPAIINFRSNIDPMKLREPPPGERDTPEGGS